MYREKIISIHKETVMKFNNIKYFFSKNESNFLLEEINSKSIPTPKLLIKNHKEKKWRISDKISDSCK